MVVKDSEEFIGFPTFIFAKKTSENVDHTAQGRVFGTHNRGPPADSALLGFRGLLIGDQTRDGQGGKMP